MTPSDEKSLRVNELCQSLLKDSNLDVRRAGAQVRVVRGIPAFLVKVQAKNRGGYEMESQWRLIETAPTDGTVIILRGKWAFRDVKARMLAVDGRYNPNWKMWFRNNNGAGYTVQCQPTHWMPLPIICEICKVETVESVSCTQCGCFVCYECNLVLIEQDKDDRLVCKVCFHELEEVEVR